MSKKSFLIFAAGAAAGWTVAQRVIGDNQSSPKASSDAFAEDISIATTPPETSPESWSAPPPVAGRGDPFRGAFAGALEEIRSHADDLPDPETYVA